MPELPDVTVYVELIAAKTVGRKIEQARVTNPFVVRSVDPPIRDVEGRTVREIRRIGKRIALGLDDDLWIVIHLMIAPVAQAGREDTGTTRPGCIRFRERYFAADRGGDSTSGIHHRRERRSITR